MENEELIAAIEAELAGREAAAAPTADEFVGGLPRSRAGGRAGGLDYVRAALEGGTMGASNPLGAGVAALAGSLTTGQPLGEAYDDIRGTLQHEEDLAREADPTGMAGAEAAGIGAALLPMGLAGAARVGLGGGGQTALRALPRAASGTRVNLLQPRGKLTQTAMDMAGPTTMLPTGIAGTAAKMGASLPTRVNAAMAEVASATPQRSMLQRALRTGELAGVGAAAGEIVSDDPGAGALLGVLAPALINNPVGRWGLSRAAKKVAGDKARVLTYLASHPASRREAKRLMKAWETWRKT